MYEDKMSIQFDAKFVRLLSRFLEENKRICTLNEVKSLLSKDNMLTHNISAILLNANKEVCSQKQTTLNHIFKYIDRRVERAVLEERVKHPYKIDRGMQSAYDSFKAAAEEVKKHIEDKPVIFNFPTCSESFAVMKFAPDGIGYIHKDYCSDRNVLEHFKKAIIEQLIKINPSLVLLPNFYIAFKYNDFSYCPIFWISFYFDNPGGIQHIVKEFVGTNSDHFNSGDRFNFDLNKLAKYFSDEVNKIAREKYAS